MWQGPQTDLLACLGACGEVRQQHGGSIASISIARLAAVRDTPRFRHA
jgi:hypothetical protein